MTKKEAAVGTLVLRREGRRDVVVGRGLSLAEAVAAVAQLEERFAEWEQAGFPALPEGDVLAHYEGATVLFVGDAAVWSLVGDEWVRE